MLALFWMPFSRRFPACWHHLFKHRFRIDLFIDLGMDLGLMFNVCLIPFPFAHATCNTFKTNVFSMSLHVFTHQKNMIVHDFCSLPVWALIFDDIWYRFRLHFGTLLALFFYLFAIPFSFMILGIVFFWLGNGSKSVRRGSSRVRPPSPIFLHLCVLLW